MFWSKKDPVTGRLGGIYPRIDGTNEAGEVPLVAMPVIPPPWAYDEVNQVAIAATPTVEERVHAIMGCTCLHHALAMRWSTGWSGLPPAQQSWAQGVIDAAAARAASVVPTS